MMNNTDSTYMMRPTGPTLQQLIHRVMHDEKALSEFPDNEAVKILLKRIERNKAYIVKCVMQHSGNPAFSKIILQD